MSTSRRHRHPFTAFLHLCICLLFLLCPSSCRALSAAYPPLNLSADPTSYTKHGVALSAKAPFAIAVATNATHLASVRGTLRILIAFAVAIDARVTTTTATTTTATTDNNNNIINKNINNNNKMIINHPAAPDASSSSDVTTTTRNDLAPNNLTKLRRPRANALARPPVDRTIMGVRASLCASAPDDGALDYLLSTDAAVDHDNALFPAMPRASSPP